ncbi:hypothetical protein C500_14096 [Natrialba magadii ATCC 43099]|uniref:Uncharacterized protein n=1 Tax=Natrialba magadii (strain ATCC 43099 / DSM 3394 / CCM 3739 / CIP 104546 / IAM 13178 / JCM 8861 / NBRC 102185 / NCIMB 2190 / MS3) TaxID=547559 RepID=L9USU3_NATMM|nr:hypothetical protein C500_14096 [Natrialba magadii ATCC 43099]
MLTSEFEFPTGEGEDDENVTAVDASDAQPAYVVGLGPETIGSAVYRASVLETSDLEDDDATQSTAGDGDAEALTPIVNDDVTGLDDLPEGWDRDSVLEFWSSIGGSWESCVEEMTDELGEDRAKANCSAMKDEVMRTQRWRNRF